MSHPNQKQFCFSVKKQFPNHFKKANVIDVGSYNVNGSNRVLWSWFDKPNFYLGIDIVHGRNVDVVGLAHEVLPNIQPFLQQMKKDEQKVKGKPHWPIDIVISTEMLEHDKHWKQSLKAMYNVLRPGGLLLITAGGDGREEHGTVGHNEVCSPATIDYYRNISNAMFEYALPKELFTYYCLNQDPEHCDMQFAGIKR